MGFFEAGLVAAAVADAFVVVVAVDHTVAVASVYYPTSDFAASRVASPSCGGNSRSETCHSATWRSGTWDSDCTEEVCDLAPSTVGSPNVRTGHRIVKLMGGNRDCNYYLGLRQAESMVVGGNAGSAGE